MVYPRDYGEHDWPAASCCNYTLLPRARACTQMPPHFGDGAPVAHHSARETQDHPTERLRRVVLLAIALDAGKRLVRSFSGTHQALYLNPDTLAGEGEVKAPAALLVKPVLPHEITITHPRFGTKQQLELTFERNDPARQLSPTVGRDKIRTAVPPPKQLIGVGVAA